ncbi:hypothetical protein BSKO_03329 [Bryopsis sp. KO-2023]|nr:hypothetical protein BSKO_03329 [Bryopsis sp. KO-2023]
MVIAWSRDIANTAQQTTPSEDSQVQAGWLDYFVEESKPSTAKPPEQEDLSEQIPTVERDVDSARPSRGITTGSRYQAWKAKKKAEMAAIEISVEKTKEELEAVTNGRDKDATKIQELRKDLLKNEKGMETLKLLYNDESLRSAMLARQMDLAAVVSEKAIAAKNEKDQVEVEIRASIRELENEAKELKLQNSRCEKEKEEFRASYVEVQDSLARSAAHILELQRQVGRYKSSLEKEKAKSEKAQARLISYESTLKEMKMEAAHKQANPFLKSMCCQGKQAHTGKLLEEIFLLQTDVGSAAAENMDLKVLVDSLSHSKRLAEETAHACKDRMHKFIDEFDDLKKRNEIIKIKEQGYQESIALLNQQAKENKEIHTATCIKMAETYFTIGKLEAIRKAHVALRAEHELLTTKHSYFTKACTELKQELEVEKSNSKKLRQDLREKEGEARDLLSRLSLTESDKEKALKKIKDCQETIKRLEDDSRELKQQSLRSEKESREERDRLQEELRGAQRQNDDLTAQVATLESDLAQARATIEEKNTELATWKRRYKNLEDSSDESFKTLSREIRLHEERLRKQQNNEATAMRMLRRFLDEGHVPKDLQTRYAHDLFSLISVVLDSYKILKHELHTARITSSQLKERIACEEHSRRQTEKLVEYLKEELNVVANSAQLPGEVEGDFQFHDSPHLSKELTERLKVTSTDTSAAPSLTSVRESESSRPVSPVTKLGGVESRPPSSLSARVTSPEVDERSRAPYDANDKPPLSRQQSRTTRGAQNDVDIPQDEPPQKTSTNQKQDDDQRIGASAQPDTPIGVPKKPIDLPEQKTPNEEGQTSMEPPAQPRQATPHSTDRHKTKSSEAVDRPLEDSTVSQSQTAGASLASSTDERQTTGPAEFAPITDLDGGDFEAGISTERRLHVEDSSDVTKLVVELELLRAALQSVQVDLERETGARKLREKFAENAIRRLKEIEHSKTLGLLEGLKRGVDASAQTRFVEIWAYSDGQMGQGADGRRAGRLKTDSTPALEPNVLMGERCVTRCCRTWSLQKTLETIFEIQRCKALADREIELLEKPRMTLPNFVNLHFRTVFGGKAQEKLYAFKQSILSHQNALDVWQFGVICGVLEGDASLLPYIANRTSEASECGSTTLPRRIQSAGPARPPPTPRTQGSWVDSKKHRPYSGLPRMTAPLRNCTIMKSTTQFRVPGYQRPRAMIPNKIAYNPNRVIYTHLTLDALPHPGAKAMLRAAAEVPGVKSMLHKISSGEFIEWLHGIDLGVEVSEIEAPDIHFLLLETCQSLNLESTPRLFICQRMEPSAYFLQFPRGRSAQTRTYSLPMLVITHGLVDLLDHFELQAVIAGSLAPYIAPGGGALPLNDPKGPEWPPLSVMMTFANLARFAPKLIEENLPAGTYPLWPMIQNTCDRMWHIGQFCADRISLLVTQDLDSILSAMLKMSSGVGRDMNVRSLIAKGKEQEQTFSEYWDFHCSDPFSGLSRVSSSLAVLRAREIERWTKSKQYITLKDNAQPLRVVIKSTGVERRPSTGDANVAW